MKIIPRMLLIFLVLILAACVPAYEKLPTAEVASTPLPPSATPVPVTQTPVLPSATPQPDTATPTLAIQTAQAKVVADAMNLRKGPGTTYPVVARLTKDTTLNIRSKAPGDQWLLADIGKQQGWLAADFLDIFQTPEVIAALPVRVMIEGFVIHGQVVDVDGKPVDKIGFAVTQGNGPNAPRTDATSLADGNFYAYLPPTASGVWTVSLVSYDCTSRVMTPDCKLPGSFSPTAMDISLPVKDALVFTYQP